MLTLIASLAGTVIAYGLVVLLLHSLRCQGSWGGSPADSCRWSLRRWAQRLLDRLVGGALLAEATLAAVWARYARRLSAAYAAKGVNPPA